MTHTSTEQPEALRLAECLDYPLHVTMRQFEDAAAELRRLHARVQELEAAQMRLGEDSERLDWLDQKNKGHPYYTGYVWQKEDYENNRGLVAAIQSKKEMMSARQAIDAAMRITQEKQR